MVGFPLARIADLNSCHNTSSIHTREIAVGVKKTGKGRRKLGRKKRRMRSRIRHRK